MVFNGFMRNDEIEVVASAEVSAVLRDLGRTEDLAFSPAQRRLAVAGYGEDKLVVFEVEIDTSRRSKRVVLTDCTQVTSPAFAAPHGLSFLDEDTLIVANRNGGMPILRLPPSGRAGGRVHIEPAATSPAAGLRGLHSPGSVTTLALGDGRYEVLVCNNSAHQVTRHMVRDAGVFEITQDAVWLTKPLDIPDGVAVSTDRRWVAVSSHNTHSVLIFENTPDGDPSPAPAGVLHDVGYPHGLRFTADDEHLVVADSGAPHVNVFKRGNGDWSGVREPIGSFRVMDQRTYAQGRTNPEEGGPKGIDIHAHTNVLATTCETRGLAFFDMSAVLRPGHLFMDWLGGGVRWRMEVLKSRLQGRALRS